MVTVELSPDPSRNTGCRSSYLFNTENVLPNEVVHGSPEKLKQLYNLFKVYLAKRVSTLGNKHCLVTT